MIHNKVMNPKLLITAGCSFSQVPESDVTWPVHLSEYINCETLYLGRGAAGNGIISRNVIYNTLQALKKYKPEELLVCILWSGANRHEVYLSKHFGKDILDTTIIDYGEDHDELSNPTKIVKHKNFYLVNAHWDDKLSQTFYKYFHDEIGSYIFTLEHILRVQWFLKLNKIKYFMSAYHFDVLPNDPFHLQHSDINYLYNQIDFSEWLSVKNMYEYCSTTGLPKKNRVRHPTTEMHKAFTNNIILPHLISKGYILNK